MVTLVQPVLDTYALTPQQQVQLGALLSPLNDIQEKSQFQKENENLQANLSGTNTALSSMNNGDKKDKERLIRQQNNNVASALVTSMEGLQGQYADLGNQIQEKEAQSQAINEDIGLLKTHKDILGMEQEELTIDIEQTTLLSQQGREQLRELDGTSSKAMYDNTMLSLDTNEMLQELSMNEDVINVITVTDANNEERVVYQNEDGSYFFKNNQDEEISLNKDQIEDVESWLTEDMEGQYILANSENAPTGEIEAYHEALKQKAASTAHLENAENKQFEKIMETGTAESDTELSKQALEDIKQEIKEIDTTIEDKHTAKQKIDSEVGDLKSQRANVKQQMDEQSEKITEDTDAENPALAWNEANDLQQRLTDNKAEIAASVGSHASPDELKALAEKYGVSEADMPYLENTLTDMGIKMEEPFSNDRNGASLASTMDNNGIKSGLSVSNSFNAAATEKIAFEAPKPEMEPTPEMNTTPAPQMGLS